MRLHLHLLSDSTGETLEAIVKAGIAQFDAVETIKHFWPMVRSEGHLTRVLTEIMQRPGLIIYTLVNSEVRRTLEEPLPGDCGTAACRALDPVTDALQRLLGQEAKAGPAASMRWMRPISRASMRSSSPSRMTTASRPRIGKRPMSCWPASRARRRRRRRSISPIAATRPRTSRWWSNRRRRRACINLKHPLIVGLTTSADRLIQIRRNRLLSLNQVTETAYVDQDSVTRELAYARRMFADNGWPVIDVTRRSIEETAAAIINLLSGRQNEAKE
jgi:regulator of PEP synthase PpsR (kinase-PPPase family)